MAAVGHSVTVDLGLDVDSLLGVSLQPSDIDLNVEVTNAEVGVNKSETSSIGLTNLETIASSGMTSKCLAPMMSLLPVVVTKTLARGAASSMVVTS